MKVSPPIASTKQCIAILLCLVWCWYDCLAADTPIHIGFNPNLWFPHAGIIVGEGWDREQGLNLVLVRFSGPATQMQGFIAGQIDVSNNNAGSLLLAAAHGARFKIIGTTFRGDITLVADTELLKFKSPSGAVHALQQFARAHQRKVRIATNPRGTMSDIAVRVWLSKHFPNYAESVELINSGDQAQLQQLFLTGAVDAGALFEPLVVLAEQNKPGCGVLLSPEELFRQQNGGFIAVQENFLATHRSELVKLLRLYQRANDLIHNKPQQAVLHISRYITAGLIKEHTTHQAIIRVQSRYLLDPKPMVPEVQLLEQYLLNSGDLRRVLHSETLFDLSLHRELEH